MLKRFLFLLFLLGFAPCIYAQDFEAEFKLMQKLQDTAKQLVILKKWETSRPEDPELYISYFNYYVSRSMTELVTLDNEKNSDSQYMLTDSSGKPAAFMGSSVKYNTSIVIKGFEYIDKGIRMFPRRLDMRFGKIYMLGETGNFNAFTQTLEELIVYDNSIQHAWLWKNAKPVEDPEAFFLGAVQSYIGTIYNTGDDALLPLMRRISETVLKYHPDHVESLSNVALTHLINGEFDTALPYLLRAEKIKPDDVVVLNNIAQTYARKKDNANARAYYNKIIKYGNEDEVADAREKIKKLK